MISSFQPERLALGRRPGTARAKSYFRQGHPSGIEKYANLVSVGWDDAIIPPENEQLFVKRMNATTDETAGSHVVFVAHPDVAARMIEEAACHVCK